VIVINNDVLLDENGNEVEQKGIDFCKSLYGNDTIWIQTSYNKNFRGEFAGIGYLYNNELDKFELPFSEFIKVV
jgi:hypothetical protein